MLIQEIKPKNKKKKKKLVGRGGKRGKTCGRGTKGQNARAGRKKRPAIRDVFRKFPKLRGIDQKLRRKNLVVVSLKKISEKFEEGETVSPVTLLEKGLIRKIKGKLPKIKVIGAKTDLIKKIDFSGCEFSKNLEKNFKNN